MPSGDKNYEFKCNLEALSADDLFGKNKEYKNASDLLCDMLIEYGRTLALKDYIRMKGDRNYADVDVVRAILGMEKVDE